MRNMPMRPLARAPVAFRRLVGWSVCRSELARNTEASGAICFSTRDSALSVAGDAGRSSVDAAALAENCARKAPLGHCRVRRMRCVIDSGAGSVEGRRG